MAFLQIRKPTPMDVPGILALYQSVAAIEGGLARTVSEITEGYVSHNLEQSAARGLCLIAEVQGCIVAEIHAYRPVPSAFSHVLSELTLAVHPECQGQGVGRRLFQAFLDEVRDAQPDILRVELIARESNARALRLYESLGFRVEGRLEGRIRTSAGERVADIPMAWHRA